MTIDVGYAHLVLPDGDVLDFVDVPGHDRLVGNMLVGAGEIDAVLLVVAADDGPRAQTREHVELLDALGLRHAVVALTKVDAVDGARVLEARAEVEALLAPTSAGRLAGGRGLRRDRRRRGASRWRAGEPAGSSASRRSRGVRPGSPGDRPGLRREGPRHRRHRHAPGWARGARGVPPAGARRDGCARPRAPGARELRRPGRTGRAACPQRRRGGASARSGAAPSWPTMTRSSPPTACWSLCGRRWTWGRAGCGEACRPPELRSGCTSGRPRSRASSGARSATLTTCRTAARRRSCGWRRRSRRRRATGSCCAARRRPSRSPAAGCWIRGRPRVPRGAAPRQRTCGPSRRARPRPSAPRPCWRSTGRCRGRGPRSGLSRRVAASRPAGSCSLRRSRPGCSQRRSRPWVPLRTAGSRSRSCAPVSRRGCAGGRRWTRPSPARRRAPSSRRSSAPGSWPGLATSCTCPTGPSASPATVLAAMDRLEAALDTATPPSLPEAARAAGCPPAGVRGPRGVGTDRPRRRGPRVVGAGVRSPADGRAQAGDARPAHAGRPPRRHGDQPEVRDGAPRGVQSPRRPGPHARRSRAGSPCGELIDGTD